MAELPTASRSDQIPVIYQDEHLIAINKPEGLLVHRSEIDRRETRFALQMLRDQIGRRVYPLHRLDKPTSGILMFAFSSDTARLMGQVITEGGLRKDYVAIVRGVTDEQGTIDYALKEQQDRLADAMASPSKPAQSAVTHYRRLAHCELDISVGRYNTARYSLVALQPTTGRKHQLRRHLKHIYHPIVGDTTHGDGKHNTMFRERINSHRLLLAATHIAFVHPYTEEHLSIVAPPTFGFLQTANQIGLL